MMSSRIALPLAWWIAWTGPFAILGWTALHVHRNWSKMPERYPTHWGFNGPDSWQTSTPANVNATLMFGAGICIFIALVSWLAYRTSSKALPIHLVIPLGAAFTCAVAVAMSPLSAMYPINAGHVILPMVAMLVVLAVGISVFAARASAPGSGAPEGWKGGLIYYNPADTSVVVENWTGLGWTLNFARPTAWAILIAVFALPWLVILLTR
jgi:uncharacterized membrane protein